MATEDLVLITGGSGFLGSHCIIEALRKRYKVRTTIRSLKRAEDVRQMVQNGGISEEQAEPVEFVVADLNDDKGWLEACRGCKYVLHVASPLLTEVPKNPDDVIKPAVEGTLRLLRAAKEAGGVRRVVLTSSMAAVSELSPPSQKTIRATLTFQSVRTFQHELKIVHRNRLD